MTRALRFVVVLLVLLVGGVSVYGALYRPQQELPAGLKGQFADVLGVRTRYLQVGSGADVLLIHGSTGSIEDWAPVAEKLAPDFRVTMYDRPGHGYSAATARHDFEYNADIALALMHDLHLENAVVAGHSYGGTTALAMAIRKPPEARAFVIVDSAVYLQVNKSDPAYHLLVIPAFGTGLARLVADSVAPKKIRQSLDALFKPAAVPPGFAEARIPIWSQPKVTVSVAHEWLEAQDNLDALSAGYKDITQPVFIISQGDNPKRRENAERLHRDVAGSELQIAAGAGHFVQVTKTDDVVALIRKAAR
jgi:pimeloyl-ACP methyl ester carboxylesterase